MKEIITNWPDVVAVVILVVIGIFIYRNKVKKS
jgi:hypothetical protein